MKNEIDLKEKYVNREVYRDKKKEEEDQSEIWNNFLNKLKITKNKKNHSIKKERERDRN